MSRNGETKNETLRDLRLTIGCAQQIFMSHPVVTMWMLAVTATSSMEVMMPKEDARPVWVSPADQARGGAGPRSGDVAGSGDAAGSSDAVGSGDAGAPDFGGEASPAGESSTVRHVLFLVWEVAAFAVFLFGLLICLISSLAGGFAAVELLLLWDVLVFWIAAPFFVSTDILGIADRHAFFATHRHGRQALVIVASAIFGLAFGLVLVNFIP